MLNNVMHHWPKLLLDKNLYLGFIQFSISNWAAWTQPARMKVEKVQNKLIERSLTGLDYFYCSFHR